MTNNYPVVNVDGTIWVLPKSQSCRETAKLKRDRVARDVSQCEYLEDAEQVLLEAGWKPVRYTTLMGLPFDVVVPPGIWELSKLTVLGVTITPCWVNVELDVETMVTKIVEYGMQPHLMQSV